MIGSKTFFQSSYDINRLLQNFDEDRGFQYDIEITIHDDLQNATSLMTICRFSNILHMLRVDSFALRAVVRMKRWLCYVVYIANLVQDEIELFTGAWAAGIAFCMQNAILRRT